MFKIRAFLYEIVTPSWYLDFSVVTSFTGGGNWARTTTGAKARAPAINESIILSAKQSDKCENRKYAHTKGGKSLFIYVTKLQNTVSVSPYLALCDPLCDPYAGALAIYRWLDAEL